MPGNGTGPFLQPRSPHGARYSRLQDRILSLRVASESEVGAQARCSHVSRIAKERAFSISNTSYRL